MKLVERAVKAKGWRWLPGMLALPVGGGFPVRVNCAPTPDMLDAVNVRYIPDLTDPATMGGLLVLVREAHKDAYLYASYHDDNGAWGVFDWKDDLISEGQYEGEALVKALEAAPEPKRGK